MITIAKQFTFDAAHRLEGLPVDHKCHRLHGHTYQVEIQLDGMPDVGGFIADYQDIADAWRPIFEARSSLSQRRARPRHPVDGGARDLDLRQAVRIADRSVGLGCAGVGVVEHVGRAHRAHVRGAAPQPEDHRAPGGVIGVAVRPRTVLSLCTGYGGLDRAISLAVPGIRLVGAVERQAYAAAVLAHQMGRGAVDVAPIYDDLESFDGGAYRDRVDLITAGFPCQGASVAGRRLGTDDERWLWPLVWRTVVAVNPWWFMFENVPGLLSVNGGGAFEEILGDLASRGWAAEWECVPAAAVGAPHRRDRLYLLAANPDRVAVRIEPERIELGPAERGHAVARRARRARLTDSADADELGEQAGERDGAATGHEGRPPPGGGSVEPPDEEHQERGDAGRGDQHGEPVAGRHRRPGSAADPGGERPQWERDERSVADGDREAESARAPSDSGPRRMRAPAGPPGTGPRERTPRGRDADGRGGARGGHAEPLADLGLAAREQIAELAESGRAYWDWGRAPEPEVRGMDDGSAAGLGLDSSYADQIHLLGNGVVAHAAAVAFVILWDRLHGTDIDVSDEET